MSGSNLGNRAPQRQAESEQSIGSILQHLSSGPSQRDAVTQTKYNLTNVDEATRQRKKTPEDSRELVQPYDRDLKDHDMSTSEDESDDPKNNNPYGTARSHLPALQPASVVPDEKAIGEVSHYSYNGLFRPQPQTQPLPSPFDMNFQGRLPLSKIPVPYGQPMDHTRCFVPPTPPASAQSFYTNQQGRLPLSQIPVADGKSMNHIGGFHPTPPQGHLPLSNSSVTHRSSREINNGVSQPQASNPLNIPQGQLTRPKRTPLPSRRPDKHPSSSMSTPENRGASNTKPDESTTNKVLTLKRMPIRHAPYPYPKSRSATISEESASVAVQDMGQGDHPSFEHSEGKLSTPYEVDGKVERRSPD